MQWTRNRKMFVKGNRNDRLKIDFQMAHFQTQNMATDLIFHKLDRLIFFTTSLNSYWLPQYKSKMTFSFWAPIFATKMSAPKISVSGRVKQKRRQKWHCLKPVDLGQFLSYKNVKVLKMTGISRATTLYRIRKVIRRANLEQIAKNRNRDWLNFRAHKWAPNQAKLQKE